MILALWILVQTSFFQNFLINKVTKSLSKNLNTTVSIKHIDLELFDKMSLEGLLVLDKKKDTLVYAGAAKVSITDWFFFKKNITLNYIGLDDAFINLYRSDSVWNYQFLIDYFSGSGNETNNTAKPINLELKTINFKNVKVWQKDGWRGEDLLASVNHLTIHADRFDLKNNIIDIHDIALDKPSFTLHDYDGSRPPTTDTSSDMANSIASNHGELQWNTARWHLSAKLLTMTDGMVAIENQTSSQSTPELFDDNRIVVSSLNGTFKNTSMVNDTLKSSFSLSAEDRGGFLIKKLAADFRFTPKIMEFKNLDIITRNSHLRNYFAMHYNHFNDDMQDFTDSVTLDGHFENSAVSTEDLAYFAPETRSWDKVFSVQGVAHGKINNMSGRKMIIKAGAANYLDGDISLNGLPDIDNTFIDFRARQLKTNYNELAKLIPSLKEITSPRLSAFGNINFSGSYTGYIKDFVTFGTLSTDLGLLKTDLHMKIPDKGIPTYEGNVSTTNFKLGKFINDSSLNKVIFSGKINGKGFNANDLEIGIDGNIDALDFNNYTYKNIIAHGDFKKDVFIGSASINDPHIVIDTLVGSINYSKLNPAFDLQATVSRLHLKTLGFTNDSVSVKGQMRLNFTGNNIDNFLGSAKLYDAVLKDDGKQLSFDSLKIISQYSDGKKLLSIETNELQANISGDFRIMELPTAFQLFLNKYYPAYISKPVKKIDNQDFTFSVKTKEVSEYVNLFDKNITGFDNSIVNGSIDISSNSLNLHAEVPQFNYGGISFNDILFDGTGTSDTLILKGDVEDVVINDSLHSPGTKLLITSANDISDIHITTNGNKALSNADLAARIVTKSDGFKLTFYPSAFTINQKQWTIEKDGELDLSGKFLMADNIRFSQNKQEVFISTQPSSINNSNDVLIAVQNLVVEDFTPLFIKYPKLQGLLDGNIRINDPFGKMAIDYNTKIERFKFEDDSIGVITANGQYLSNQDVFKTKVNSSNDLYNFNGDFSYQFKDSSTNQLSGAVILHHSEIHFLEPYLSGILSDIHGRATGQLSISGKASAPKLTGSVSLDNTTMKVDYTQCRYILEDSTIIAFNPDEIDFGNIKIKDTLNHTATLTGKIYHTFFDNFFFNELHLKTDPIGNKPAKFVLLNTTARDNTDFYGNVIGQAELSINGFVTDLHMNISGEATDSSHIYLPTGATAETGSMDYIEFTKFGREMKTDLQRRENTNIKVDMELTANPLVKIDVILDQTTGDVIKAQGSGKLNISAGTSDPLIIRGRYEVEQGDYTFNFQTFFRTPFTLQKGYIEWSGDPYLAKLDIDAIYRAENVDLSAIPTSTGYTNTKGDVDIIFKLRGTLKDPAPQFEFQFPFDNPLKSDPIATQYLDTRYQGDPNELNNTVTSLLMFNTFLTGDESLLSGNNTGNFVTRTVGQLLSATLTSSLNNWLQKLFNTNSVNLYTNINTSDFNFQKGADQKQLQNVGNFGVKTTILNNKLLLNIGGNLDYRLGPQVTTSNSSFLFTPDVSFEYLITPDGRLRVIGFNRSETDIGDLVGLTRSNRTGLQLSYRKNFDSFAEFFTNQKKEKNKDTKEKK